MFKKIKYKKHSYSQCGEDLIIDFIFNAMKIKNISYIDIGAHHPFYLSNTALFYDKGFSGICIEPDPILFKEIKKYRKRDICLNVGIGLKEEKVADFFLMSTPTLNTFSQEEADKYSLGSYKIIKKIKLPLLNINDVIKKQKGFLPNFVSLDVEGLDFEILKSFDFDYSRPEVFCIETLTFTEDNSEVKMENIINYMEENDYLLYADTYINTIFVDKVKWENR